jgi:hypothetical protein
LPTFADKGNIPFSNSLVRTHLFHAVHDTFRREGMCEAAAPFSGIEPHLKPNSMVIGAYRDGN